MSLSLCPQPLQASNSLLRWGDVPGPETQQDFLQQGRGRLYNAAMSPPASPTVLSDEQKAFITMKGLSISAASTRPAALPSMARSIGSRVVPDGRITIFFASTPAAALLDDVRRTGAIAVVFSFPGTHETLQIKAVDAEIVPLAEGDTALIQAYQDGFVQQLGEFGYSATLIRALITCPMDDVVGVSFNASAIFSQTPGPRAGEPLSGRS